MPTKSRIRRNYIYPLHPDPLGWRPFLLGWRPWLPGWRCHKEVDREVRKATTSPQDMDMGKQLVQENGKQPFPVWELNVGDSYVAVQARVHEKHLVPLSKTKKRQEKRT